MQHLRCISQEILSMLQSWHREANKKKIIHCMKKTILGIQLSFVITVGRGVPLFRQMQSVAEWISLTHSFINRALYDMPTKLCTAHSHIVNQRGSPWRWCNNITVLLRKLVQYGKLVEKPGLKTKYLMLLRLGGGGGAVGWRRVVRSEYCLKLLPG